MGSADEDDGEILTFLIGDDDRAQFPELEGIRKVYLWETDTGFVGHTLLGAPKLDFVNCRGE